MTKNLLWMLAAILTYGCVVTSFTSCSDKDDDPSGTVEPQFNVEQDEFKWDFTYNNKVYLDPRINKDIITPLSELMPNQQGAIDEDTFLQGLYRKGLLRQFLLSLFRKEVKKEDCLHQRSA